MIYLAGDPFDDEDLDRGQLHQAQSCILLTNKNSKNSLDEDYKNILTALQIKKYVYNRNKNAKDQSKQNIKLIIQLIKPESKYLYFKSLNLSPIHDQLIIVEEIKMNLLAKSCFAPGLIACMSNLSASASTDGLDLESKGKEWLKEYASGIGHEIYRVQINEADFFSTHPLSFKKIADISFTEFNAVIFALEIEIKNKNKSIVRLNPTNFLFKDWTHFNYYLYIICEDESQAVFVQKLQMPDEKFERYMGRNRHDKSFKTANLIQAETGQDEPLETNANLVSKNSRIIIEDQENDEESKSMAVRNSIENSGKNSRSKNRRKSVIKKGKKPQLSQEEELMKNYNILQKA